ncbi:cytochrome P450 [Alienimonas californiensis]|uniref:Fatty-acid peroxygenase n=1 Tax=Alienimonas californiensis TaxID=2527989 RepID=A0A517PDK6_9PLAN|nr:cytochrome P450 [Alienimonas californiensis]QDT17450.1 Fatty-acid peroxygenase [Alienimonas californiensis]
MSSFRRVSAPDSSLGLLREGYEFISNRCRRLNTDAFRCRLMLSPAICVRGREAAEMFYTPGRFTRQGAVPATALTLLQDRGSVQTLDGDAHRRRKGLFLEILSAESVHNLVGRFEREFRAAAERWATDGEVELLGELQGILTRAGCAWVGAPVTGEAAEERTREFAAMIDGAGAVGPRHWRGQWLRQRTERWARDRIRAARAETNRSADSPLTRLAAYRDANGEPLDEAVAAVELLNLTRPVVAVARFITFAALALHEHPDSRESLTNGGANDRAKQAFAQEVRRFYPFFPAVGGRVREPFEWRGRRFEHDEWVLLDLYGTNHDADAWGNPETFRPDRFAGGGACPHALVPQGGGPQREGHRCPGEDATLALLRSSLGLLLDAVRYEVPPQDLSVDLSRIPAEPASRFRISNVQVVG